MFVAAVTAGLFLGVAFTYAGLSKLLEPLPAAQSLVGFGLSRRPSLRRARVVGVVELVLGIALMVSTISGGSSAVVAMGTTTAILALFAVMLARAVAIGATFECACFGGASPVGKGALLRTLGLAVVAALATTALSTDALWNEKDAELAAVFAGAGAMLWISAHAIVALRVDLSIREPVRVLRTADQ